ncbi:MAG: GNAT family N-acetyltransferase [Pirellulales bacterium]|nr:GNAT family N-acetyltransferase [Pirellulales bacterium]
MPSIAAIEIRREELTSPLAQSLILALNAELEERYPEEGANFFRLDPEEVAVGRGAFLVVFRGHDAIGCGAVRRIEPGVAELKRMYVSPTVRGQGVGRLLLESLEAEARQLGVRRLLLETGPRQHEAMGLYERAGFVHIPTYGEYCHTPHPHLSVCMAKDL